MLMVIVGFFSQLSNIYHLSMKKLKAQISHKQLHERKHQSWLGAVQVVKGISSSFHYFLQRNE
jgi:hypothetical protein